MSRILLVDDDPGVLFATREVLSADGYTVVAVPSGAEALAHLSQVDMVLADYAMPGMDGLELLRLARERDPSLPVVLITAQGSERVAVRALKGGAYDYLTKPTDIDELEVVVRRALEMRALRLENRQLVAERALGRPLVAGAASMRALLETVTRVGSREVTVLVRGETGTGKELVVSLLHASSARASGPLVRFNCAAIPSELAEAELFGHAEGAFTGAKDARRGFLAQASGGTLVLDEVGELSAPVQAKLLRALQEGEIQPLGTGKVQRVDFRLVASTNADLLAAVRAGRFREDLYYRLAVVELVVPPLRDRKEDVPALAKEFARRASLLFGLSEVQLTPELLSLLQTLDWPGNVRELENAVTRMVALSVTGVIGPEALVPAAPAGSGGDRLLPALSLREQVELLERSVITRTLASCGGNQTRAAEVLELSRSALVDRLRKYGLLARGSRHADEPAAEEERAP